MISLIIPCYNEQESLPIFYKEVTSVVRRMGSDYELLFVDDGSKNRTLFKYAIDGIINFSQAPSFHYFGNKWRGCQKNNLTGNEMDMIIVP